MNNIADKHTLPYPDKKSNIGGWLLVFVIIHMILALYYFTSGVYAVAGFLQVGGGWFFAAINICFCMILPITLLLLIYRKKIFKLFYFAFSILMVLNYLSTSYLLYGEISILNVIFGIILALPWLIYVFKSKRIKNYLYLKT